MNDKPDLVQPPDRLSLKRWSRRKLDASRAQSASSRELSAAPAAPAPQPAQPGQPGQPAETVAPNATPALPPIEALTIDSEFAAFFKPEVPEATKRAALKQLFRDPRFNVMDGLDVYIDDYTQPDPIPDEMMKQLLHSRHTFNPPKTEVNAEGHVVDVVDKDEAKEKPDTAGAIAASDGAGDVTPDLLPRAVDGSAEPDKVRPSGPRGDAES